MLNGRRLLCGSLRIKALYAYALSLNLVKRREELITGQTGLRTLGIAVLRAAVPETHGSNRRQILLVKPENFVELRKINAFERRRVDAHAGCGEEEEPHADVGLTSPQATSSASDP